MYEMLNGVGCIRWDIGQLLPNPLRLIICLHRWQHGFSTTSNAFKTMADRKCIVWLNGHLSDWFRCQTSSQNNHYALQIVNVILLSTERGARCIPIRLLLLLSIVIDAVHFSSVWSSQFDTQQINSHLQIIYSGTIFHGNFHYAFRIVNSHLICTDRIHLHLSIETTSTVSYICSSTMWSAAIGKRRINICVPDGSHFAPTPTAAFTNIIIIGMVRTVCTRYLHIALFIIIFRCTNGRRDGNRIMSIKMVSNFCSLLWSQAFAGHIYHICTVSASYTIESWNSAFEQWEIYDQMHKYTRHTHQAKKIVRQHGRNDGDASMQFTSNGTRQNRKRTKWKRQINDVGSFGEKNCLNVERRIVSNSSN